MSGSFSLRLALSRAELERDHLSRSLGIDALLIAPEARAIVLHEGSALLTDSGGLALVPPSSVASHVLAVFLGRSPAGAADVAAGAPIVALVVDDEVAKKLGGPWGDLRSLGWRLGDRDAGLFTQAVALVNWHESATFSPRTGAATVASQSGWVRIDPDTGAENFPRTDPAVIVAVTDADDRLLLGSNALWEAHRFSLLAGFVEPGESLEAAVLREVFEEAGIVVTDPVYLGSQPWPFPASLMVGFRATVAEGEGVDARPDGEEILELRWFTREQLAASLDDVLLPGRSSIARAIIEDWYGGRLGKPVGEDEGVSTTDLLDGLDEEQRLAAETLLGPVCVLAGAGTGKTRALTHRIAHGVAMGVYAPERVMALTFTTRAAGELRTRLRALGAGGVAARTFHSAALAQLSFFWPQLVGGQLPRVLASKGKLLGQAAEALKLKVDTAALRDVAAEIEWRKVGRMSLDSYARAAASRPLPPGLDVTKVTALQEAYERIKDERRQIDFEDVLLVTAGMIEAEPRVAQQVRGQYRFFVVDEYQDVSPLQQELLELWLGSRTDICVVGDASQTIYSFAGASSEFLLGFGSRYEDATILRLERNYRSAPAILDTANRLMRGRPGALELSSASNYGASARAAAPRDDEPGVTEFESDAGEARAVAAAVAAEIASGTRPERIAVLYRVNAQAATLETAFAEARISTRQLGGTKFFDLDVVKRAVLELRSAALASPRQPLFQSVSDVLRGIGWTLEAPEGGGAVRERWEALTALVELADQAAPGTTLTRFAQELIERQAAQHEPTVSAVVLSTLHGAKGLEWESVHLVGLSEGLMPISHARGFDAIDEERRLLYVGITRARQRLALSWAREGLRGQRREPSRFLAELRTGTRDAATRVAR